MRKHEMIYVFYKHLPLYDLSSHTHKFKKKTPILKNEDFIDGDNTKGGLYCKKLKRFKYERKLDIYGFDSGSKQDFKGRNGKSVYEPPLPTTVLKEEDNIYGVNNDYSVDNRPSNIRKSIYDPPLPTSIQFCKSKRGKHSTQKPVDLIKWILKYYSKEGDICLDITAGSGSVGIACKEMNRKFILIEKEEKFINIIKERLNEI